MQTEEKRLHTDWLLIPEELIMDILSHLPVKSLMRFKLVCKSFNSLISNPYFVKLHLRQSSAPNADPLIIFYPPYDLEKNITSLHVKSFLKTPPVTVAEELQCLRSNWKDLCMEVGSCNGLVCLIGSPLDSSNDFWVCFWNPTMRSTTQKRFPIMPPDDEDSYLYVYCGFGYDHVNGTYKVLVLQRNQDVMVINMGGNGWRHVGCFPPDLTTLEERDIFGVHLNGTLNWLAINKINENNYEGGKNYDKWENFDLTWQNFEWDNGSCMILSFDLNKEEFVRLVLPPHKFRVPHLGVLDECLCVSHYDMQDNYVIWQMKKFGIHESWTKLLSINTDKDLYPRGLMSPSIFPLHKFDNGDLLMLPEDYLYNHRNNRLRLLETTPKLYASCAVICCESLISPR